MILDLHGTKSSGIERTVFLEGRFFKVVRTRCGVQGESLRLNEHKLIVSEVLQHCSDYHGKITGDRQERIDHIE